MVSTEFALSRAPRLRLAMNTAGLFLHSGRRCRRIPAHTTALVDNIVAGINYLFAIMTVDREASLHKAAIYNDTGPSFRPHLKYTRYVLYDVSM